MAEISTELLDISQDLEIRELKKKYGSECKVISDVGDFKHVVIIRPSNVDVSIKFQLTVEYPNEKPGVITRSDTIAVDCVPEVQETIENITRQDLNHPVIDKVTQSILRILQEKGLDTAREETSTTKGKKSKGRRKQRKYQQAKEENVPEKKASLKTAADVIKRIQWDGNLPTENFKVGYLDRFEGIMERDFAEFTWDDLSTVDQTVLAIPQHRIQYFKYLDVIIWDKNKWLDYMFGSTDAKIGIHDVIQNYDHFYTLELDQNTNSEPIKKEEEDAEDTGLITEDNDLVNEDFQNKFNFDLNVVEENLEPDWEISDGYDVWGCEKKKKQRPNYFLAFRITDDEICKKIAEIQETITEKETRLISCCAPLSSLHVTLCTLGLDTTAQIAEARKILSTAQSTLADTVKDGAKLQVEGIDNFFERVIYAKVHFENDMKQLVVKLITLLEEANIEIRDNFELTPHLTILKVSRTIAKELKTKRVNKKLYEHLSETKFGMQVVDKLHLCEMSERRRDDGFYITPLTIALQNTAKIAPH